MSVVEREDGSLRDQEGLRQEGRLRVRKDWRQDASGQSGQEAGRTLRVGKD
jgi:hypothetical protein